MKKFIVLYHSPAGAWKEMKNATPEEMKKGMESWMVWAEKCGKALVDMGTPLGNGERVTKGGSKPSTKGVIGYSILQAESLAKAKALLKDHPHLDWAKECEIEIHESLPTPGS